MQQLDQLHISIASSHKNRDLICWPYMVHLQHQMSSKSTLHAYGYTVDYKLLSP